MSSHLGSLWNRGFGQLESSMLRRWRSAALRFYLMKNTADKVELATVRSSYGGQSTLSTHKPNLCLFVGNPLRVYAQGGALSVYPP